MRGKRGTGRVRGRERKETRRDETKHHLSEYEKWSDQTSQLNNRYQDIFSMSREL